MEERQITKQRRGKSPSPDVDTWLWFHSQLFNMNLSASAILAYLALCYFDYKGEGVWTFVKAWRAVRITRKRYHEGIKELIARGLVRASEDRYILTAFNSDQLTRKAMNAKWGWIYRRDFKLVSRLGGSALLVYSAIAATVLPSQMSIVGPERLQQMCKISRRTFYPLLRKLESYEFISRERCGRHTHIGLRPICEFLPRARVKEMRRQSYEALKQRLIREVYEMAGIRCGASATESSATEDWAPESSVVESSVVESSATENLATDNFVSAGGRVITPECDSVVEESNTEPRSEWGWGETTWSTMTWGGMMGSGMTCGKIDIVYSYESQTDRLIEEKREEAKEEIKEVGKHYDLQHVSGSLETSFGEGMGGKMICSKIDTPFSFNTQKDFLVKEEDKKIKERSARELPHIPATNCHTSRVSFATFRRAGDVIGDLFEGVLEETPVNAAAKPVSADMTPVTPPVTPPNTTPVAAPPASPPATPPATPPAIKEPPRNEQRESYTTRSTDELKRDHAWLIAATEKDIRKAARGSLGAYLSLCLAKRQLMSAEEYEESLKVGHIDLDSRLVRHQRRAAEGWRKAGIDPNSTAYIPVPTSTPAAGTSPGAADARTGGFNPEFAPVSCKTPWERDLVTAAKRSINAPNFSASMDIQRQRNKR